MTAPHYYGSTSGILVDRFIKYGLFPFALGASVYLTRDFDKATRYAQLICLAGSAGITTTFLGLESRMIESAARDAVSATMGVDPEKLQFSDFKNCSNTIARKAYSDLMKLQKYRYGTDALFALPIVAEKSYSAMTGRNTPPSRDVIASLDPRHSQYDPDKYTGMEKFLQSHVGFAMSPYAGKAAYWTYESFSVPKTGYYEIVKLLENLEDTGKNMRADDLMAVYQRTRDDRKVPKVGLDSAAEYQALYPLFQRMADEYNKHDGHFTMSEVVYLIGENKINIHAEDNVTISKAAIIQSQRDLDKVIAIGLKGIREENRRHNLAAGHNANEIENRSFVDRVTNGTVNTIQRVLTKFGYLPDKSKEYLSVRDPASLVTGEIVNRRSGINI